MTDPGTLISSTRGADGARRLTRDSEQAADAGDAGDVTSSKLLRDASRDGEAGRPPFRRQPAPRRPGDAEAMFATCKLTVQCSETTYGESLCLTGAPDELGVWRPEHSVRLQTSSTTFPSWTGTICLRVEPHEVTMLEFKLGIMREGKPESWRWEPFAGNRTIKLNPQRLEMIVVLKFGNRDFSEIQYLSPPASPANHAGPILAGPALALSVPALACQSPLAPGPILLQYSVPPLALGPVPYPVHAAHPVPRTNSREALDAAARARTGYPAASLDDQGMTPLTASLGRRSHDASGGSGPAGARRAYRGPPAQPAPRAPHGAPFAFVPAAYAAAAAEAARQHAAAEQQVQLQLQQQQLQQQQQHQQRVQRAPAGGRRSHSTPHSRIPRLETIDEEAFEAEEEGGTPPLLPPGPRRLKARSVDASSIQALLAQHAQQQQQQQCYCHSLVSLDPQQLLAAQNGFGRPAPPQRCYAPLALNPEPPGAKPPSPDPPVALAAGQQQQHGAGANGHHMQAVSSSPTNQGDYGSLLLRRFVLRQQRDSPTCPATHAA
eukprot:tig00021569_g22338.t1